MSSTEPRAPQLLVFSMSNGSGKSTVTKGIPIVGLYDNSGDEPNLICEVEKPRVTIWENDQWSRGSLLALLAK